jgi:RNA polymerase sigma-70 factor, ECF subfamily
VKGGEQVSESDEMRTPLSREVRERLPSRDPAALEIFFDAFFSRIHGYLRRLVADEHLAEDLTQDVFLHLYRALPSYDPARELDPWVFTVATNKVRDHWRSRRHHDAQRETSTEGEELEERAASETDAPEAEIVAREDDEAVREAVDSLPDTLRATVLLRVYEGMSFRALAEVFGRSELAVRKRYSRALASLRERLRGGFRPSGEGDLAGESES